MPDYTRGGLSQASDSLSSCHVCLLLVDLGVCFFSWNTHKDSYMLSPMNLSRVALGDSNPDVPSELSVTENKETGAEVV